MTVYCIVPERVTGKKDPFLAAAEPWTARNLTKPLVAKPPGGR